MTDTQQAVRERYAAAARTMQAGGCCSSPATGYTEQDLIQIGLKDSVSLGCGNPTLLAQLKPGEKVLDLGSGGGMDVLLSARRVGPEGHAYGVDMTDEMLALAEHNRRLSGLENATFLKGTIDAIPLPEAAVDVVISNCVINLADDKRAVLREAFRVLRPGGRLAVADTVEVEALASEVKRAAAAWAECVAGALPVEEYRALLEEAGFASVEIEVHSTQQVAEGGLIGSAYIRAAKPA